jgi:hypothetical protein
MYPRKWHILHQIFCEQLMIVSTKSFTENLTASGVFGGHRSAVVAEAENIMARLEEAIAVGNHREAARLAKEVSKVTYD